MHSIRPFRLSTGVPAFVGMTAGGLVIPRSVLKPYVLAVDAGVVGFVLDGVDAEQAAFEVEAETGLEQNRAHLFGDGLKSIGRLYLPIFKLLDMLHPARLDRVVIHMTVSTIV